MSIFITVAICRFGPSVDASMFVLHCSFRSKLYYWPRGTSVRSSFCLLFFFFCCTIAPALLGAGKTSRRWDEGVYNYRSDDAKTPQHTTPHTTPSGTTRRLKGRVVSEECVHFYLKEKFTRRCDD